MIPVWFLVQRNDIVGIALIASTAVALAFVVWFLATQCSKVERERMMLALVLIELADLVFAVDSVPAVLAISQDPFIVYTSNIFAILGLRALYFALAALMHRFI